MINADNGPENSGVRSQWLKRLVEFSARWETKVLLAYYPPYHSKYNPIERCWGVLEEHWNGEILDSVSKAVNWAGSMTWKGIEPVVGLVKKTYERGIRYTKKEMKPYEKRIKRSDTLPKWDVRIDPIIG